LGTVEEKEGHEHGRLPEAFTHGVTGKRKDTGMDNRQLEVFFFQSFRSWFFFGCFAATQPALQLHQEHTQVVRSRNRKARPNRMALPPWTLDSTRKTYAYADIQTKENRTEQTSINTHCIKYIYIYIYILIDVALIISREIVW